LIEATHAVVVGAGLGGIASALRLRARGYQVTLVDKCDSVGGRGRSFEIDGYKFDCGPTIITAPFLLDQLFELYGKKASDYYKLVPMMPWYRIMFADNSNFDYGGTTEATIAQINKFWSSRCTGLYQTD
jgi:phytoene desaturase